MAYLNNIILGINEALKGKLSAFPTAAYSGIANQIARKAKDKLEFLPATINEKGDAKWMTFDDLRELTIYHRIANSTYSQLKNQSYGDGYNQFQHALDVDLIVMADRKRVGVTPDVLEAALASNLPDTIEIPATYVNILPVSANHNSKAVFGQEFQGIEYNLKPEHILFSIRYRVELRYPKGCISLCQCD